VPQAKLDTAQYYQDQALLEEQGDVYSTFNLVIRRKAKENNFKSILETIRDLMNTRAVVPEWLHDVFLGYGDPGAAQPVQSATTLDFRDTFVSSQHLAKSFPGQKLQFASKAAAAAEPPVRVTFPAAGQPGPLLVESYKLPNQGPYPVDKPRLNQIPFTPVSRQLSFLVRCVRG
jgi:intron-binding protein aquarius